MLAEPQNQDKEALRTNAELSSSEVLPGKPSPVNKLTPYLLPFALYQIITGCFLSFASPSYFHSCLAFMGCISLTLLASAIYWHKRGNSTENIPIDQKHGRATLISMLVCAFLKLSTTPLVLSNISFQKSYMLDYRDALQSDPNKTEIAILYQSHFIEIYEYMMTAYAFIDVALLLFSLPLVLGIFRSVRRTGKVYTSFNFIFNTVMLAFALTLIYKVLSILDLEAYSSAIPPSLALNFRALLVLGGLCAGLSLSVWLVNARKWRIGYFTLSLVFIALSTLLAVFSSSISSYASEVYSSYSDTRDLKEWRVGMLSVPQEEIEDYGCPAKYISSTSCEKELIVRPIGTTRAENTADYCLNKDCAGLLGQFYAEKCFQVADWGLTASVNTAILAFSLLYYSIKRREQISSKKISRHYKWLILLGIITVAYYSVYLFNKAGSLQDSNPEASMSFSENQSTESPSMNTLATYSMDSLEYLNVVGATIGGQPIITPPPGYIKVREASNFTDSSEFYVIPPPSLDHLETTRVIPPVIFAEIFDAFGTNKTINATNIGVAENVQKMLNDMIVNQTYSYVILGLNQTLNGIDVLDKGKTGNVNETISKLNDSNAKIAVANIPVGTATKFLIIVYTPDSTSANEKAAYNNSVIPQANTLTDSQGIPVLITSNSSYLKLPNLLKYTFDWPRNESPQFKTTQIPTLRRESLLKSFQQNISSMVFRLKGTYIDTDVEKSLNEVVVGRKYRYVLLDWGTSNLLKVVKKAPKNTTYDEFLKDLVPGKSQLALLDFQFQDKDVPVLISWTPEKIYTQQWQTQVYELILNEVNSLNIPYSETNDITALSVANLTDFLMSFWTAQVNTYSKYNSTQLLSIFESLDSQQKDPESLLGSFYKKSNATGPSLLTNMLLRRSYKYILFNEVQENGTTQLILNKTAPIDTSFSNFFKDVKGNGNQLALLYLDFLNLDKIVCLAIINQKSLEQNYVSYARIAAATEVYDIPMAYVASPEKIDMEQLTLFTFAPEILHILDTINVDPAIQTYWKQFSDGTKYGYITFILQDNYSKIKLQKAVEGVNTTYQNFTTELTEKQPFYAILNLVNTNKTAGATTKPLFVTWIPQGADLPSKILYKQAEALLFPMMPGSEGQQKALNDEGLISS